ncbi:hypothetical protein GCM10010412_072520 [Nonomuraea recticatena]|uniref:Transposase n=1 Tax=Nonomuraea recticatena TaxID=46178 RepID=A0ABP6F756_9ACTN
MYVEDRGLRVDGSRVVHRPGTAIDHRGEELPAPDCHTGIAGWDVRRLRFTSRPITCKRCLRKGTAGPDGQLPLPDLVDLKLTLY